MRDLSWFSEPCKSLKPRRSQEKFTLCNWAKGWLANEPADILTESNNSAATWKHFVYKSTSRFTRWWLRHRRWTGKNVRHNVVQGHRISGFSSYIFPVPGIWLNNHRPLTTCFFQFMQRRPSMCEQITHKNRHAIHAKGQTSYVGFSLALRFFPSDCIAD